MFISRRVYDPSFPIPGNRMKRTTGLYGHWPRLWSCKNYNWTYRPGYCEDDEFIASMQKYMDNSKAAHSKCRRPRHIKDAGYLRYVGRKRSWTLWYHGNPYRPGKIVETSPRRTPTITKR